MAKPHNGTKTKTALTAESALRLLAQIIDADPRRLVDQHGKPKGVHELDDATAAAISSIEIDRHGVTKVRFHSKPRALKMLMRHLGLFEADNKQRAPRRTVNVSSNAAAGEAKGESPADEIKH
ncbi:terminase small subunit [Reyranella sp.]|uniref:terminase small subunit n=1 Tax=Reyranella sp. TaxID=1929291 RepID=UPI0040374214